MVLLFFYKNFTNTELIKMINNNFEINDGYVLVESYDNENNILKISNTSRHNNTLLYGKIVNFDMKLEDVIEKINKIQECRFKNKTTSYSLTTIWANNKFGNTCKTYIIY